MKKLSFGLLVILATLVVSCAYSPKYIIIPPSFWLSGTNDGISAYETYFPKRETSEHTKVVNAGFWVYPEKNGNTKSFTIRYEYTLTLTKPFSKRVFTRAILANPEDPSNPFVYNHYININEKSTKVYHSPVKGLVRNKKYKLVFEFYDDEARSILRERVSQDIKSPIGNKDTCIDVPDEVKKKYKVSC